jgi:hypothetical protein
LFGVSFTRAEGLMGVPVGDQRPLTAESFGQLTSGGLHRFSATPYLIRVDKMDLVYMIDGIDRGPAPTVSIVRPDGSVAASQVVYPNNPMRYGSLTIHPGAFGLSPGIAIVSKEGSEGARTNLIVDFADDAPGGTRPAEFALSTGEVESVLASVTVPLAKQSGAFVQALPSNPKSTFVLRPAEGGAPIATGTISVGDALELPDGSGLRLLGVGYYARLSIVDDQSIPLVYALLVLALVGVSVSILGRQTLAVAAIGQGETGSPTVDVFFRDWRSKYRAAQAEEIVREALAARDSTNGDTK